MKTNYIYLILVTLFFSLAIKAQELKRPVVTGATFLQVIPDARSGGMGETGVATIPDAFSQFHNPSKFMFFEEKKMGIGFSFIPQYLGYVNDIFHANLGYYQKLNNRSAVSGSLTYFNFGKLEVEEEMAGTIINQGAYNPNEMAVDLSYILKLHSNFGMSISGRYIRSSIFDKDMGLQIKSGNAVSVDIAGFFVSVPLDIPVNKWTFGFNLKNLGSKLKYGGEAGDSSFIPAYLKIGGGYHLYGKRNEIWSFYLECLKYLVPSSDEDNNISKFSSAKGWLMSFSDAPGGLKEEIKEIILSLGSEYQWNDLKFRTGYTVEGREKGFKNHLGLGVGFDYNNFLFDFAYQLPINNYGSLGHNKVLKLSISYNFRG